ncbi:MAG: amino acid ABC transporter permease [Clostridia bacterium]|mgnify:FL=1|nr:amino acid ABC transporter permease [Clostridiales bacterium]MDD7308372.1 amino acid ABC transporter permease [Eubacteriales bacterium]MDO4353145.1 amino acid ABC transporter permease [Clostridia bacterium]MEE0181709.1 amino acid ABC transporter permease [Anaerovoracaceae bacterium]
MFETVISALNEGFVKTFEIFVATLIGALPLGLLLAFGTMSKFKPLKAVTRAIVWVVRGTPLMLQLLVVYYGPGMIMGNNIWGVGDIGRNIAVYIAFIINYACYFAVVYRGGIEGIPQGQHEAGHVLGLTKNQIFFKIVFMQVIKRIMAPMSNEIITLVKDTSLARIILVYEVIWAGQTFIKSSGVIWPLFFTAVYYLLFVGILTIVFGKIEKKLDYYRG